MSAQKKLRKYVLATLAASLALGAPGIQGHTLAQMAKARKTAAASGQPASGGGGVQLHVGLVISDAVRAYKQTLFLTRIEFGRRLADKAVNIFNETFVSVRQMSALPADRSGYQGLDLVVVLEVPDGRVQTGFLTNPTYYLDARFTVRNANGVQMFQAQESASDKSGSPAQGPDAVGEAVVRKFIQELILNQSVRNILAPPPPQEVKVARDDSAALASAGLDVPPPPPAPWAPAAPASSPAAARPITDGRP